MFVVEVIWQGGMPIVLPNNFPATCSKVLWCWWIFRSNMQKSFESHSIAHWRIVYSKVAVLETHTFGNYEGFQNFGELDRLHPFADHINLCSSVNCPYIFWKLWFFWHLSLKKRLNLETASILNRSDVCNAQCSDSTDPSRNPCFLFCYGNLKVKSYFQSCRSRNPFRRITWHFVIVVQHWKLLKFWTKQVQWNLMAHRSQNSNI